MASTTTYKRLLLLLIVASVMFSCGYDTKTINVDGRYSVDVPQTFKKVKDLNDAASLQCEDAVRKLYTIVIDEPKDALSTSLQNASLYDKYTDDLNGYSQLIIDGLDASVSVKEMPPFEEATINGLKARILSFEGVSSGTPIYWKLAFIEGNTRYYQVMVWTEAGRRGKQEAKMAAIINSFKDTDKTKRR